MPIIEFTNIALKNLKKRKLRAFLTLVGILIAVATIFVLVSLSLGLEQAIEEQFRLFGTDKFFIQPRGQIAGPGTGSPISLTQKDVDVVSKIPGVKDVTYWIIAPAKIEFRNEIRYTNVLGVDLKSGDLLGETNTYEAEDGRMLKEGDTFDITIGSQYKHQNFLGKQVTVGDRVLINDKTEFKVKGILKTLGNPSDDRLIYMPEAEFRELFNVPLRIDAITVQVDDEADIQAVADRTQRKLLNSRDLKEKNRDFSILTPDAVLEAFGTVLNILTAFLLAIAAISVLVGGIGIANTMYTSTLERTREIGVMKAIGARNSDILSIFLIEAALLGLVGGILGVLLGFGIAQAIEYIAITQLATTILQVSTPLWLVGASLAFAIVVGTVSGFLPAYQATKIKPVEALRYE